MKIINHLSASVALCLIESLAHNLRLRSIARSRISSIVIITLLHQGSLAHLGGVVVHSLPHNYPAGLHKLFFTALLHRICVFCFVHIIALGDILLGALGLLLLLHLLHLLLHKHTHNSITISYTSREVNCRVLKLHNILLKSSSMRFCGNVPLHCPLVGSWLNSER